MRTIESEMRSEDGITPASSQQLLYPLDIMCTLEATGTHVATKAEANRSHKVLQTVKHNCGMDIWSGGDIIIVVGSNSRRETQFDSQKPTEPVR
jgi:hypothetical protein